MPGTGDERASEMIKHVQYERGKQHVNNADMVYKFMTYKKGERFA